MIKRGIHMSAQAVREILAGTKTQIRVLPKEQPEARGDGYYFDAYCSEAKTDINPRGMSDAWCWWTKDHRPVPSTMIRCPYGKPGDGLWVKEEWQAWHQCSVEYDEWEAITEEIRQGVAWSEYIRHNGNPDRIEYRATSKSTGPWTLALFMPRWASRLALEVVEVRVQRLQEISEDDARAEGCHRNAAAIVLRHGDEGFDQALSWTARGAYAVAWDDINVKRRRRELIQLGEWGYPGTRSVVDERALWGANPWVWAITFRRMS